MKKFKSYKELNLSQINKHILEKWDEERVFNESVKTRSKGSKFIFYEGPPSANGKPGIHHIIARTIKDLFCRYKTLKGYQVNRKAGWDTHGLPVELGVEKELGITKEDIGSKISIQEYNRECKSNVMKHKDSWEEITKKMGYWVNMESPYITYDNKYIESVWWLLSEMHKKKLLYKGHTVQPYSPKAGTGLSTHELNQPGCYRNIKDTSVVAQFKLLKNSKSDFLYKNSDNVIYLIAWTTTPWTLPSNTALGVGEKINYLLVDTFNRYTGQPISVIIAKDLMHKYFHINNLKLTSYKKGDKDIPYKIKLNITGSNLNGLRYEQLLKYAQPKEGDAFKIILADFVTTEDGTGIVHLAPSFGADDNIAAKKNGIGSLTLVNKQGKFTDDVSDFAGMYVKNSFYKKENEPKLSADVQIIIKLKENNLCFKSEKYDHSYPHCWRTDKPILYYPMDSWFVKTTEYKERMLQLNNQINWKPKSTGQGRFENWLENLVDWNLSRSRFWGIPIPIWRTKDTEEEICIGSLEQLKNEIEKSISLGFMKKNPLKDFTPQDFSKKNYLSFDLHRPYVDEIILASTKGKEMKREKDLIDVWFDSGAMPYAQIHYPFENKSVFKDVFPADFIAEGVDQTRGWFFTLHAISTMLFDSVAYKNVISNGLVLDAKGNKMSKRLGNATDPFRVLEKYGADATRWYMIVNAQPWDNLKFDEDGIEEIKRKFFGTLHNTYSFFSIYANIDSFSYSEKKLDIKKRAELDQWIISELNTLIKQVEDCYEKYEPTKAGRLIQDFSINKLSNWYVRLSRRRFWKGEYNIDKVSAYQTLYECLEKITILSCPIAPFFMDNLFRDLNSVTKNNTVKSVHLATFPSAKTKEMNVSLEEKMKLAQNISTLTLSLRKKEKIRVRQPLEKIMIPVLTEKMKNNIEDVKEIILSEVNVKKIKYLTSNSSILTKKVKPNFRTLGPKFGENIKLITKSISKFKSSDIEQIERNKYYKISNDITITLDDVEITSGDIPGYTVSTHNNISVALDISISKELKEEGLAREFINRIQNLRKEKKLEVTDKIDLFIIKNDKITSMIKNNLTYICDEILATKLQLVEDCSDKKFIKIDLVDSINIKIKMLKS